MSNLSQAVLSQKLLKLREVLNPQFDNLSGKYNKPTTEKLIIETISRCDEVACFTIVNNTCMRAEIIITTHNNEIYYISAHRLVLSEHKNIAEYMQVFWDQPVDVRQVHNQFIYFNW